LYKNNEIKKASYILTIKVMFLLLISYNKNLLAENLYIGVASNFLEPINIIKEDFKKETGHNLIIINGSSGSLYSQIMNGGPIDIFLSAEQNLPKKLEKNKKSVIGTRFTYARGELKLWSLNKVLFDKQFPEILNSHLVKYIGIGNPLFVPYGYASKEVLEKLDVYTKISDKLILGKNINQVFLMGYSRNLDLAFVAKSNIISNKNNKKGKIWNIPQNLYSPINQDVIMLLSGKKKSGAFKFLEFLVSDNIKKKIRDFGYIVE
jgi:molybdate transport system substrate-binding protein